jgi:hypothetical protein
MISRKGYYANYNVRMEIIKQQMHRETVFLPYSKLMDKKMRPIRWLKCNFIAMLLRNMDFFSFLEKEMNLYYSLAKYPNMPMFNFQSHDKKEEQRIWLEEFHRYITQYDMFIETDNPDWRKSYVESKKIKELYDKFKVEYSVKFSGTKGFHFLIPYENWLFLEKPIFKPILKKIHEFDDLVGYMKLVAEVIYYIEGIKNIDLSVIDVKRFIKSGYSWDVNSGLIALPLSDEQFENFNEDMVKPDNVLKMNLFKRGMLYRNSNLPLEQRQKNLKAMLEYIKMDEIIEQRKKAEKIVGIER